MPVSVRMVPGVYDAYLATMATAAAALIGLLFVAVSVRDDTIFGAHAMPGGEALAITAFTGLVNSLVVSLLGLIPKINIGEPAVIMAVIGIVAIVRLHRRLHTGRNLIVLVITFLAAQPVVVHASRMRMPGVQLRRRSPSGGAFEPLPGLFRHGAMLAWRG
jgi:hypothetical protein